MQFIIIATDDACTHVGLEGRLDALGAIDMDNRLSGLVIARKKNTVLDLTEVSFLSSVGIRLFVKLAKALALEGKKLILASPRPMVKEVVDATGIDIHIQIESDPDKAVEIARAGAIG